MERPDRSSPHSKTLAALASTGRLFSEALQHHQAGRLREAARLYGEIIKANPLHAASHHHLGIVALQTGEVERARESLARAVAVNGQVPDTHYYLGLACGRLGRFEEAAHHNRQAIALRPEYLDAHLNLGNALKGLGNFAESISCYERVLQLKPDSPEAHFNLGNILNQQAEYEAAIEHYRAALLFRPDYAEACNNLGTVLVAVGNMTSAIAHYERAVSLRPSLVQAWINLGKSLLAEGKVSAALNITARAFAVRETSDLKTLFVQCAKALDDIPEDHQFRLLVVRALTEIWGRQSDLAACAVRLVEAFPAVSRLIKRAANFWPKRLSPADWDEYTLSSLTQDQLLLALLNSTPVTDIGLERFLTSARLILLSVAERTTIEAPTDDRMLEFSCALAQQCFINEYVFDRPDDEWQRAERLANRLSTAVDTDDWIPVIWLVAVAAYRPLHSLSCAEKLVTREWRHPILGLIMRQIREPMEESRLRATIPSITDVDDRISRAVQQQYEENPYPRWASLPPASTSVITFDEYVRRQFPLAPYSAFGRKELEYLIAGCGTGRHAIMVAQTYADIRILAIDLSRASLAYAKRKTAELGLRNIDYASGDILKIASIGRLFDVIDSTGVLHHMADPWHGWRALLSLLKPKGVMRIGLYSHSARRDVVQTMAYIGRRGYGRAADDIRRCRQELADFPVGSPQKNVTRSVDFYSTSDCRDWIFHVQQHNLTIPAIKHFLDENNLEFLGFELDARTSRRYELRFPNDRRRTNLDHWHSFEAENPYIFSDMYVFLVQMRVHS
jgi:tetratricopeptide (TPR) repeat protein/2-polyprenyl-3-methyl-5-hydroxy-6-metoxy-1,4-benzoquinol methylase